MRRLLVSLAALALAACAAAPPTPTVAARPSAVVGVGEPQLSAEWWIRRQAQPSRVVLDAGAIAAQNAKLFALDRSVHDIAALPASLDRAMVTKWISGLSERPTRTLYDEAGREVPAAAIDAFVADANLDTVPVQAPTRYGMVVRRADLRTFPTRQRVFSTRDGTDIDRFQESALFPGTPVVLAHESRDRAWWFVVSPLYAAWIEKASVAEGDASAVFAYAGKEPHLVITGATARTVHTPEQPGVSELQLDMGVRVPLLAGWPADQAVNGQHPYTSHVIELPVRDAAGRLAFVPALLPKTADAQAGYLPLTPENVLRQGFKFLGERYGWGHSYNARDCSGFVSEVYRSFGVTLPRNTRDMGTSPALNRIAFDPADDHATRLATLRGLAVGDLVFIPGHVMMVIGQVDGEPYVIHDTTGITWRDDAGEIRRAPLNAVSVSPLTPLLGSERPFVDVIYSVQRIRP